MKHKPGEKFNAFQKKKKQYSESDMGSMKGYDPTGGLGNKGYAKATSVPKATQNQALRTSSGVRNFNGKASYTQGNANSTKVMAKKKNSKKKKSVSTKKTGKFDGKSNELGQGGRAAQLKARGVPGAVIGALARRAQAAPGQKNFHKKHKKVKMHCKSCGK